MVKLPGLQKERGIKVTLGGKVHGTLGLSFEPTLYPYFPTLALANITTKLRPI